jgi:hypothetical protein
MPNERVSGRPEDWLSAEELAELRSLIPGVVRTARRELNKAIRPLRAAFADEPKRGWYEWYDSLDEEQRKASDRLRAMRSDRAGLNLGARRAASEYATVDDLLHGLAEVGFAARKYAAGRCPGADRLGELCAALADRRDTAAEKALGETISREVAKRNSDEGWAKELERRAGFSTGTAIRVGRLL